MSFLCQYCKWTNIYYSTWGFENVAKNCQFQFLDHPLHQNLPFQSFQIWGGGGV